MGTAPLGEGGTVTALASYVYKTNFRNKERLPTRRSGLRPPPPRGKGRSFFLKLLLSNYTSNFPRDEPLGSSGDELFQVMPPSASFLLK